MRPCTGRLVSRVQVCPFITLSDSDLPEVPGGEEAPRRHIVYLLWDWAPKLGM